jgi:hypothetical protein
MANLYFNNLHGSGAGKTAVKNGTDEITVGVADDLSKVVVTSTTSAGVATVYEAQLFAENAKPLIFTGSAVNAAAVYAIVGTGGAVGALFASTTGSLFVQVANAAASTDWEIVTTT